MRFRAGHAGVEQALLQTVHKLAVLRVHGRNGTEFQRPRETVHQDLVTGHDRAFVGHEMLEAVDAMLTHERAHVFIDAIVPPGYGDVERVVGDGLLRPAAPLVVGIHDVLLRIRDHEVDDHRGAARRRGRRPGFEALARYRAHERQFHMRVRVDTTRHDVLSAGIDDPRAFWCVEIGADVDDLAVSAEYVCRKCLVGIHNRAAFDQYCHDEPPRFATR